MRINTAVPKWTLSLRHSRTSMAAVTRMNQKKPKGKLTSDTTTGDKLGAT